MFYSAFVLVIFSYISLVCGTYSLQFSLGSNTYVMYEININEVPAYDTTDNTNWINFDASPGDTLKIVILEYDAPFDLSYVVNNGADGSGTNIYNSTSTTFTPFNSCTENDCQIQIDSTDFQNNIANVYVNNVLTVENYSGTVQTFYANVDDTIRVEFTYVEGSDIKYTLYFTQLGVDNYWYYNAFGSNTIIYNPNLRRGPFGGLLYPITSEQSSEFAKTIGAGMQKAKWTHLG